jgi:hypothetical protein
MFSLTQHAKIGKEFQAKFPETEVETLQHNCF